jgi:hypothetical protein
MSRDQRLALDAMLRKAPQPFGPMTVEQMRKAFAAFMATFPIPADVRRTPAELAGRPALLVEPEGDAQQRAWWPGPGSGRSRWTTGSPRSTRSRPGPTTR